MLIGQMAHIGGIWDTKHLIRCLPEVARCLDSTSLGPLYEALGHAGTPQPEVRQSPGQFVAFAPGTPLDRTGTSCHRNFVLHVPSAACPLSQRSPKAATGDKDRVISARARQVLRFLESRKPQQEGPWRLPQVDHAPGFLRYSQADAASHAHEAGHAHPLTTVPELQDTASAL